MKRVIITGPTGAIGTALIRNLAGQGISVTAVCRPGSDRNRVIDGISGVEILECDLSGLHSLSRVLSGSDSKSTLTYDVFYHLGWAGTSGAARNDCALQLQNIKYTLDAVELAHTLGCKRFVGVGSQAEYGSVDGCLYPGTPCNPENGYGIAKLSAGRLSRILCEQYGMEHVWTRVLSVYGENDGEQTLISSLIQKLLKGETPHCTKGEQTWDYIYSGDAAELLSRLGSADANGKTFCIGGGNPRKLSDYMEDVRAAVEVYTGKPVPEIVHDIPYPEGQVMTLTADLTDLRRTVGPIPQIDFKEGIKRILEA